MSTAKRGRPRKRRLSSDSSAHEQSIHSVKKTGVDGSASADDEKHDIALGNQNTSDLYDDTLKFKPLITDEENEESTEQSNMDSCLSKLHETSSNLADDTSEMEKMGDGVDNASGENKDIRDVDEIKSQESDKLGKCEDDITRNPRTEDDDGNADTTDDQVEDKVKSNEDETHEESDDSDKTETLSIIANSHPKDVTDRERTPQVKVKTDSLQCNTFSDLDPTGFRYVDANLLTCFIAKFPCPECLSPNLGCSNPSDVRVTEKKIGLASILEFTCESCEAKQTMSTSARAGPSYEVNGRFNAAMFNIKTHFNKAKRFCADMKLPEPMSFRSWTNKSA